MKQKFFLCRKSYEFRPPLFSACRNSYTWGTRLLSYAAEFHGFSSWEHIFQLKKYNKLAIHLVVGPVFHIDVINLKMVCLVEYIVYLGQY